MKTKLDSSLLFSFPTLHPSAELQIFFQERGNETAEQKCHILEKDGEYHIDSDKPLELHFRPRELWDGKRYPFAILLTISGRNMLRGNTSHIMERSPQNYIVSPPQGAVDSYIKEGKWLTFQTSSEPQLKKIKFELTVVPMKKESIAVHERERRRIPGRIFPPLTGLTLDDVENRCEPLYEDLCSFGDWDREQAESTSIWLSNKIEQG